jgi:hypothetical protein
MRDREQKQNEKHDCGATANVGDRPHPRISGHNGQHYWKQNDRDWPDRSSPAPEQVTHRFIAELGRSSEFEFDTH